MLFVKQAHFVDNLYSSVIKKISAKSVNINLQQQNKPSQIKRLLPDEIRLHERNIFNICKIKFNTAF